VATAISERSTTDLEALKAFLGVNGDADDELLENLLAEVKSMADDYSDNDYLDADDAELEIPRKVELWIKTTCARYYSFRENGVTAQSLIGVGDATLGPLSYTGLTWVPYI
jgi:Phage gp6-like head-tail connector protein